MTLPVKLRVHIGSGEIDGNGASHRDDLAGGEAGGGGVGLTALAGVQVEIGLLVDRFALIACAEHSCGVNDVPAAEGQACALIDRSSNGVIYNVQRHGGIHRDVLGAGAVGGQRLTNGRNVGVGEGLLSADGVLTGHGDSVDVVMDNGLHAEGGGVHRSVFAHQGLGLCVYIGHGEGGAHAYPLTAERTSHLDLDRQAVVGGRGGSGGVDLVGRLGIQLQNTGQLQLILCAGCFQTGENGLGVGVEHCQGEAAGHAHVGSACAGDSGGADAVAHIFNLAGIAVLGGKLGNGSLQKQVQTYGGHHLLLLQLLTEGSEGVLILQQGADKEAGVKEQVCQILEQCVCQRHSPGGDSAQRIAFQIGEHDFKNQILYDTVLIVLKLSKLLFGELLFLAEIFDVFLKELLLLFFGEVVQQGVFVLLGIQKGLDKNISAGFGIREVAQKLGNDLVHAAAVCRFQHVCADNEILRLDGLCAHIGFVLVFHIVDCRCGAHADGAVAGGGVREDHGVGILEAGNAHVTFCLDGHPVRNAGKGLVGMDICRDGGCHLHAALQGLHTGELACLGGDALGAGAAVFAGHAVDPVCRLAQGGGVILVDLLCRAVLVHGLGGRGLAGLVLAADQVIEIRDVLAGDGFGVGHRRGTCPCRAGVDILAYAADGLCGHLHALCLHAAIKFSHGGVVQNGETHCRAYACPAAHCLCVGDELAYGLGVRGDVKLAGHFGHAVIELAHKGLCVHGADRQRHHRRYGDTAGGTGRSLNIEVCFIVGLGFQRAQNGIAEADAVFDLGQSVDVHHFHRDARAHACGAGSHLESGDQGDADAADGDAPSGALAGGVGHGGVSAAAGGDHFHIAAVQLIACLVGEHCAVIDIGHMHGDRAADAQLGHQPLGGMARLGNGGGACVQGLGFDAQILRADCALADPCLVAVHEHADGDRRADGVFGSSLQAHIGAVLAQDGGRAVKGAVCPQGGNATAGGMDAERPGSADALCHIHFRQVGIVDIGDAQSAHHLVGAVLRRACGGGGVLEKAAHAVGAGERIGGLAAAVSFAAEKLGHELSSVKNSHLVAGGHVVEGDAQRHGVGSHVGEGVNHHIVHGRDGGAAVDDSLGGVEDKVACDEQAGLGIHVPHDGGLAGGVAGAVHDAGGQDLQRAARVDPGVVGDPGDGLKLHHGKGDGELEGAAHGVGRQVVYRVYADQDAALSPLAAVVVPLAGDQACHFAHGHPGVAGGNGQGDGDGHAEKLVCGVDGNIHIGACMDVSAGGELAVDGDIGVAEFQGNGVKVLAGETTEDIFPGDEALLENQLRVQVDDLLGAELLVFYYININIAVGLVESQLHVHIIAGVQVVLHYAGFDRSQRLVLGVDGEDDVLCRDGAEHVDLLAGYQKVQSPGVQTVDAQLAADGLAQVIGEDKVGEEDAAFGQQDLQIVQIEVDILIGDLLDLGIALFLLDLILSVPLFGRDHIVCEGLERVAAVQIFHRYGALVEQRVGEGFDVLEEDLEAFGKIKMERVVGQIAENDDLRHGFKGDLLAVGADGNALVFINVVVELAGQVQAVIAGLVADFNAGAAPCRIGGGGVHGDQVVALAAVKKDAAGRKGLAVQLAGDEVDGRFHEVLGKAEVAAAGDAESVLAVAAVHHHIGRAHVHGKAEGIQGKAIRVGVAQKRHDHVAGVNEPDAAHVLAVPKLHLNAHGGGGILSAVDPVHQNVLQHINIRKDIIKTGIRVDQGRHPAQKIHVILVEGHGGAHIGPSSHFHVDRVIARAAVQEDVILVRAGAAPDVGDAEVYCVVLYGAVVFHAVGVVDADGIAGGEVQARQHQVYAVDVDVYAALQLYIALGPGIDLNDPSLLVLHNGVVGHDANGQITTVGGAGFQFKQIGDQLGENAVFALPAQVHAVQVQAVLHHDGGNTLRAGLFVPVQIAQVGQRIREGLVDGVAVVVGRVGVLDLFADLMDVDTACGDGVGLYLHLVFRDGGLRFRRVVFPGSSAGPRSGSCPVALGAADGSSCGRCFLCGSRVFRCDRLFLRRGRLILRRGSRTVPFGGRCFRFPGGALRFVRGLFRFRDRSCRFGSGAGQRGFFTLCPGEGPHGRGEGQHGAKGQKKHGGAEKHPHCALCCRLLSCVHVRPPFLCMFVSSCLLHGFSSLLLLYSSICRMISRAASISPSSCPLVSVISMSCAAFS